MDQNGRNPSSGTTSPPNLGSELPGPQSHPPVYGVLTRTLIHSPVVKQIIPARIRGQDYNDVVFVGETFIELYLLGEDGKLCKIATKADFQADIRHARVLDCHKRPVTGIADDAILEDTKRLLPPQILVLAMDSGHMCFLYAISKGSDVQFIMSMRRIDAKGVHPKHLGKSLAIDPRSQCLAVTAYQDTFRLFALYDAEELERQLQVGMPLNPIKQEKTFNVSGVILHMEFLHPAPGDSNHVIMVLLVADSNQKFRLFLYEWWTAQPLNKATRYGHNGLLLPDEVSMPLHIIPLLVGTAFLIITEFCIHAVRASDVISGNPVTKIEFPQVNPNGGRQSLVTSWARPLRTSSHTQTMDDLYLAMEDGDIYFVEVGLDGPHLVQLVNKAGHLDCAIGSAFAALDYGLMRNDLLVAGGEMSSGGVYILKIGPSSPVPSYLGMDDEPKLEETVANWSPVFDFDLINPHGQGHDQGKAVRDRMYACTGRGQHGAIAEIRCGVHGMIISTAEYVPGIRNLWVLPTAAGAGLFLLCAFPDSSTLCYLNESAEWEDVSECEFLDMLHTTLAAAAVGNRSVQITPRAININELKEENMNNKQEEGEDITMGDAEADSAPDRGMTMWSRQCAPEDVIVAAAIKEDYMVISVRTDGSVRLNLVSIASNTDAASDPLKQVGLQIELQENPSFVSIIELGGQSIAVVGTREATLQFYMVDLENGLIPVKEQSMLKETDAGNPMIQRDLFICESAALIKGGKSTKLLCGLRDGTLIIFDAKWSLGDLSLERKDDIQFGPIPVQALSHVQQQDTVFVLAGPELYRFTIQGDEVNVAQIVFEGTAIEPALVAVSQINSSVDQGTYLICATKDQIFYAEIGHSEKVCVRRLPVLETPRRVLYYKPLNTLIVACSKSAPPETSDRSTAVPSKRGSSSTLCFLNPRTGECKSDKELVDSSKGDKIFGRPNEQIYGLTEWNMELESKFYRYIAVGTGFVNANAPQSKKGRLLILSASANLSGKIEVRRRFQIKFDAPVYSVAPYGKSSLVFCSGLKLYIRTLNPETRKLDETAEYKLRSPGVQITVKEPFIHVSCGSDSLCVVKVEGAEGNRMREYYSDEIARNGFSHYCPFDNFFIVSDKQYGVTGLWQPPERRNHGSLHTIFEAEVTSSISRIRGGYLRPPWHANKPRPGVIMPERDIIGSGVDGSIFQITILNVDALRLLRYMQELYMKRVEICRGEYGGRGIDGVAVTKQAEPLQVRGDVDGDLLMCVVKLGAEWLREAVERGEREVGTGRGGMRFEEMVDRVLTKKRGEFAEGERSEMAWEKRWYEEGDAAERAVRYVRELLEGVML